MFYVYTMLITLPLFKVEYILDEYLDFHLGIYLKNMYRYFCCSIKEFLCGSAVTPVLLRLDLS